MVLGKLPCRSPLREAPRRRFVGQKHAVTPLGRRGPGSQDEGADPAPRAARGAGKQTWEDVPAPCLTGEFTTCFLPFRDARVLEGRTSPCTHACTCAGPSTALSDFIVKQRPPKADHQPFPAVRSCQAHAHAEQPGPRTFRPCRAKALPSPTTAADAAPTPAACLRSESVNCPLRVSHKSGVSAFGLLWLACPTGHADPEVRPRGDGCQSSPSPFAHASPSACPTLP